MLAAYMFLPGNFLADTLQTGRSLLTAPATLHPFILWLKRAVLSTCIQIVFDQVLDHVQGKTIRVCMMEGAECMVDGGLFK